jgi:hypothetical protein
MGSSSTQQENKTTAPWAPQAAALQTGFDAAGNALTQSQAAVNGGAPKDYTAQFDPALIGQFNNMLGYANNTNTGALNNAGNQAATNGANGSQAALTKLLGYDPSTMNNPSTLIDQANQYVAGQNIPGQVQAGMFNATQNARDVQMPGIAQAAAGSGNSDSSRRGIAEGMVQRGLAQQGSALEAQLGGQAFGQGLQLASNNAQNNNQSLLTAAVNAGNVGNSGLYAGTGAVGGAINGQGSIFGMGTNAGQGLTAAQQANLTNQQQQYQGDVNNPYGALMPYMKAVGSQLYGTNTNGTTTTQNDPGVAGILGGAAGAAGSLASGLGSLGWAPFAAAGTGAAAAGGLGATMASLGPLAFLV